MTLPTAAEQEAKEMRPACPNCMGRHVTRQGLSAAGKARWRCKRCGNAFAVATLSVRPAVVRDFPDDIRIAQPVTIPGYRYGSSRLG